MFKLLSHLRAARLFLRCQPYVELPGGFWSPADAAAFLAFRQTPAGRKLGLLLANQVTRAAVAATANTNPAEAAHQCGYASGIRGTVTVLDSLLPPAPPLSPAGAPSGDNPEPPPFRQGTDDALAHLRP